jgi:small-conductance mechanosensitive channel
MGDTKQNGKTGLDKIGALLEQMGITEEARKEFLTVCENWYNNKKQELQTEFDTRLGKAKKVCIEETEAHKASLSRGLKLFLENKVESIRKAAEKNAAIAESEAVVSLKKIQEVLGGLNIDGAENAQTLQAERKKNANLTAEVANLQEQMNTANAKVAKFSDIAEKSLQRQSTLEEELQTAKKCLTEAKQRLQVISEGKKGKTKKPLTEHKRPGAKPKTKKPIKENKAKKNDSADDDISIIAEQMD